MAQYEHSGGAVKTTISSVAATSTSIVLADATNWPTGAHNFWGIINQGNSNEEHVKFSARAGTTLTVAASGRGADGTTAAAWASGTPIVHGFPALEAEDFSAHIYDTTRDDHTQYLHDTTDKGATGDLVSIGTTAAMGASGKWMDAATILKLGSGAVSASSQIASAVISGSNLASATVSGSKIASATVSGSNIASATVSGSNLASATVSGSNIAAATVSASNMVNATVTDVQLASNAVTTAKITDLNVTLGKLTTLIQQELNQIVADPTALAALTATAGQIAYVISTGLEMRYTGSAWVPNGDQVIFDSTLGAPATSISATGLTQLFNKLEVFVIGSNNTAVTVAGTTVRFNNDSGANYTEQYLLADNASIGGARTTGNTSLQFTDLAGTSSADTTQLAWGRMFIPVYAAAQKHFISTEHAMYVDAGAPAPRMMSTAQGWNAATAINRIDWICGSNMAIGSRMIIKGLM